MDTQNHQIPKNSYLFQKPQQFSSIYSILKNSPAARKVQKNPSSTKRQ